MSGDNRPIDILYEWTTKEFPCSDDQSVGDLLEKAVGVFGLEHLKDKLVLVDTHGHELEGRLTLGQAGVEPGSMLVLREAGDTSIKVQWSGGTPPWGR